MYPVFTQFVQFCLALQIKVLLIPTLYKSYCSFGIPFFHVIPHRVNERTDPKCKKIQFSNILHLKLSDLSQTLNLSK